MIPKVIHYVWLGGNKMPKIIKKCIKSWQKNCPDYEIKRWDESNLDLNKYQFAKDAYNAKKWAFASDVFRFDILFNEGGIYLDTDVEVLKKNAFDKFLGHEFFTGFEHDEFVNPGLVMGMEAGSKIAKDILKMYKNAVFDANNLEKLTVCIKTTDYLKEMFGLKTDGSTQIFENNRVAIYSPEYFCPKHIRDREKDCFSDNSQTVHHYAASWVKKHPIHKRIYWWFKDHVFAKNKKRKINKITRKNILKNGKKWI